MNSCDTTALLSYHQALEQLTSAVQAIKAQESKPLKQCLGKVLAQDIKSSIDVPSCAMSAMDGYAINTANLDQTSSKNKLSISQRIAAGHQAFDLKPGTAARIFTGAPIPGGADAVVMQEQVELVGDKIEFEVKPTSGSNIRPRGNDIESGNRVLQVGCRIRAQDIGLAASIGLKELPVFEPLRVGIFFTGDELVEPGEPLGIGKIYDSNRYTLYGLLETMGCEIIDLGLVGDTLDETKKALLNACEQADLVVTSGGVSVGDEDHVRIALEQLGQLNLWRLAIKPGKPLAFGKINGTAFLGLPGNPVSVFVTFCIFVCPVIQILQGQNWQPAKSFPVTAAFDWLKPDSRREFLRARLELNSEGETTARVYAKQDSGVLTSTVWADGFIEVAENETINKGDKVNYLPFSQYLN